MAEEFNLDTEQAPDPIMDKHFEAAGIPVGEEGEGDDSSNDENKQADDDTAEGTKNTDEGSSGADADSEGGADDSTSEQGKEKKEGANANSTEQQLKPGDIRADDGSIVRAGKERRWYENLQIEKQRHSLARKDLQDLRKEADTYKTRVQAYEQASAAYGAANPTEVGAAMRLYRDLRQNPAGTLQTLVAEMKAAGHTVALDGAGIDTAAISALIDQKLGKTASAVEQQQQLDPQQEARAFYAKFPDALTHDEVLAQFVARNPNLSNEDAYWQLRQQVVNEGYDWSKPIRPQYEARMQQNKEPAKPAAAAMPNGRVATAGVVQREDFSAKAGNTTDDIVRAAMRENGLLKT